MRKSTQRRDLQLVPCRCLDCGLEFTDRRPLAVGETGRPPAPCPACGSAAVHLLEWFVVHTNRQAEPVADRRLRALGYETFFPQYRTLVRHARRVHKVLRAFLPRYLFVGLAPGQGLYGVNTAEGVATVLSSGGRPQRLPDSVVTEWRQRMGEGGIVEVAPGEGAQREKLKPGESVTIPGGPFAEFPGIVELDNGREITVWATLFDRRVKVQFPAEWLSPVVRRQRG